MLKFTIHLFLILFLVAGVAPGPAAAQDRFIDNGDHTVTDNQSGLMWAQTDNQADIFWKQANQWINDSFAGSIEQKYANWRLPTVGELQTLYIDDPEYSGYQAACGHEVKMAPLIRISCILVWTSDTSLGLPLAFNFNLGNAFTVDLHDNAGCRVLAVRTIK